MKGKKAMKKIISIIAAACMLMTLTACGHKGGRTDTSPTDISPGDIEVEATPTPQPQPVSQLSLCGIPIVSDGQPTGLSYQGVEYADGVLTLDGIDMVADYSSANAIYFVGSLELVIRGTNTLSAQNSIPAIEGAAAEDGSASDLIISGNGSLTITADGAYGLSCTGTVTVNGGALDITGTEAAFEGGADSLILGDGIAVTADTGTHLSVGAAQ